MAGQAMPKKYGVWAALLVAWLALATPASLAAPHSAGLDTAVFTLYFRVNEAKIDPSYMGNEKTMTRLRRLARADIARIDICAESSPEGRFGWNRLLAARRARALRQLLVDYFPNINTALMSRTPPTNSWLAFRPVLEKDDKIPHKKELLRIIDDRSIRLKDRAIRDLGGGKTYTYLKNNVLVRLRMGRASINFRPPDDFQPIEDEEDFAARSRWEPATEAAPDSAPTESPPVAQARQEEQQQPEAGGAPSNDPPVCTTALKTNLLFDAVGAPNLGVEQPLGKHFSVALDAAYAYWRINNRYALQTLQGGVAAKYWFGWRNERALTGWNAGVYGMCSPRYDVQWQDGYQGNGFWSAGVSGGYAMPLTQRLNLEFALAAGYFYTPEVRHYHRPEAGHLMWQETRRSVGRIALTKAQVNLVWLLYRKKK